MLAAYAACNEVRDRPSVIFAYTVKGWGLPIAGDPRNHSALLLPEQIDEFAGGLGLTAQTEWDRFDASTAAGILCSQRREALRRDRAPRGAGQCAGGHRHRPAPGRCPRRRRSAGLWSACPATRPWRPYLVMSAPDVATSTNLAGLHQPGRRVRSAERRSWRDDPVLRWSEGPTGQHIELGISEMNLFLLLGQLGLAWDLSGQPLLPVGTVYDPFVCRGLDAFIYSVYSGARFLIAGTPSGVTLAPEGGAHQSTITPSIGLELPNVTFLEPAYAAAVDWLVCDALGRIASGPAETTTAVPAENGAYYFRLSTRPLDQAPFAAATARIGEAVLRRQVLAGAYRLVDASALAGSGAPQVHLAASGAVLPEVLAAAAELADEGIAAHVVDVTSLDRPAYGVAAHPAARHPHGGHPVDTRRAARGVPRPRAAGDRARRGLARDGLARLGARRPGRAARRGPVRPVRQRPRAVRAARPAAGLHRQRRPGRPLAGLARFPASHSRDPVADFSSALKARSN